MTSGTSGDGAGKGTVGPMSSNPDENALDADLPALPHTWRPLGVRLAAVFFGVVLLVVTAFAAIGLDGEVKAKFTPFQVGTLVFLGLLVAAAFHALARSRVTAGPEGLTVVNGYRRRQVAWHEIEAIRMPVGAPWATLYLGDDEWGEDIRVQVMALQGSDGDRARLAVLALRGLRARYRNA